MILTVYFLHIFGATVVAPLLGLYVITRNPYHKVGRALFAVLMLTAVQSLFNLCFQFSPDDGVASAFGRLSLVVAVLLVGSMLFLASYLPYSRHLAWPAKHPRPFWAVLLIIAVVSSLPQDPVNWTSIGDIFDAALPMGIWGRHNRPPRLVRGAGRSDGPGTGAKDPVVPPGRSSPSWSPPVLPITVRSGPVSTLG